jgi:hypothetical protein
MDGIKAGRKAPLNHTGAPGSSNRIVEGRTK